MESDTTYVNVSILPGFLITIGSFESILRYHHVFFYKHIIDIQ